MPVPLASQSGSFWNSFSFDQLNILPVDIPCVLKNDAEETMRSTQWQPVTLYITVTVSASTTAPNLHDVRHRADEAMVAIVRIDRSKTWESAVERINWVIITLSPIAEVRTMPFLLSSIELTFAQLFPLAKMPTVYFQ